MKKLTTIILLLTLFGGLSAKTVRGSGEITKQIREVSDFHKVELKGFGTLVLIQGETESLEIECDDNILPYIKTKVIDKTLSIKYKNVRLKPTEEIVFTLFLKELSSIEISGSADVISDKLETPDLEVDISGSSDINIEKLIAESLEIDISGSGEINIGSGTATKQDFSVSGSGDYFAGNLKSEAVDLSISGSGKAEVWATEKIDIDVSGSGRISYYGTPQVSISTSGSGNVKSLGEK